MWHAKESLLLNVHECRVQVKICNPFVMVVHWMEDWSCPKICPLNASVCVYIWGQNVLLSKTNYSQYNVTPRYFSVSHFSYQRGVKALLGMLIDDGMLLSSKSLPFEFIVRNVINLWISCINTTKPKGLA